MKPFIDNFEQETENINLELRTPVNEKDRPESPPGSNYTKEEKDTDSPASYLEQYLEELFALFDLEANDIDLIEQAETERMHLPHDAPEKKSEECGNDILDQLSHGSRYLFTSIGEHDFIFRECMHYYSRILAPFSTKLGKKMEALLAVKLPHEVLCSEHFTIWKEETLRILERFHQRVEKHL